MDVCLSIYISVIMTYVKHFAVFVYCHHVNYYDYYLFITIHNSIVKCTSLMIKPVCVMSCCYQPQIRSK